MSPTSYQTAPPRDMRNTIFYIWWRMQGSNLRPPACKAGALPAELILHIIIGDPYGIRTRVTAVKGRCLNRLTNGPLCNGGERGIRTLEAAVAAYTISNRAPSASRTALHGSTGRIRTYDRSVNSRLLYH